MVRDKDAISDLLQTVVEESPSGCEALYMAALLANSPLPYEFALAVDGTLHSPSLLNPAAACFAAAATLEPLASRDLIRVDAGQQLYWLPSEVRERVWQTLSQEALVEWAVRAIYALNLILPDAEPENWKTISKLMPHVVACRKLVKELDIKTAAANRVLHQVGFSLYHQRKYDEAVDFLEHALNVDRAVKGELHPDICEDLEGLGTVLWAGGHLDRAVVVFEECFRLQKRVFTEDNPVVVSVLNSLGRVHFLLGQLDQAEETLKVSLRVVSNALGEDHPLSAPAMLLWGELCAERGEVQKGLEFIEKSLAMSQASAGQMSPDTAMGLYAQGLILFKGGNYLLAARSFEQCLQLRKDLYGEDHQETVQALAALESCVQLLEESGHVQKDVSLNVSEKN